MFVEKEDSLEWLHHVRLYELKNSINNINSDLYDKEILEIGSGTGFQLNILREYSSKAVGIDVKSSAYQEKVSDIIIYDGQNIPFPDSSFDVVFSSNVLEHIKNINQFHNEVKRVLKKNGICIHILPSHYWRFWTSLFHYPWVFYLLMHTVFQLSVKSDNKSSKDNKQKAISFSKAFRMAVAPRRHGERGNFMTEIYYFHPIWWKKNFIENGWNVENVFQTGLFYWSHDLFRFKISIPYRQALSKYFGSACYSYILRKKGD